MYQFTATFSAHARAHEAVIGNEHWYGDDSPDIGESFNVLKANRRLLAADRATNPNAVGC